MARHRAAAVVTCLLATAMAVGAMAAGKGNIGGALPKVSMTGRQLLTAAFFSSGYADQYTRTGFGQNRMIKTDRSCGKLRPGGSQAGHAVGGHRVPQAWNSSTDRALRRQASTSVIRSWSMAVIRCAFRAGVQRVSRAGGSADGKPLLKAPEGSWFAADVLERAGDVR